MIKHLKYLKYVVLHKLYVLQAGLRWGVPFWQLVIHDWSKFTPEEWSPYVEFFYGKKDHAAFKQAWEHHINLNPHHPQYWVDLSIGSIMPMPERYILEMLADWEGASRAQGKGKDIRAWYIAKEKTPQRFVMHDLTRQRVDTLLKCDTRSDQ